jgi:hypothetical protein
VNLFCQEGCFDREPIPFADTPGTIWLKCSICGKINVRRHQTACGSVVYAGSDGPWAAIAWAVVECSGEIECGPGSDEPPLSEPIWADTMREKLEWALSQAGPLPPPAELYNGCHGIVVPDAVCSGNHDEPPCADPDCCLICDECDGSGTYYIDGEPRDCVCKEFLV